MIREDFGRKRARKAGAGFGLIVAGLLLSASAFAQQTANGLSTVEDFSSAVKAVPCKNDDRERSAQSLFEAMGASTADISLDKYKTVENVVVRKPGSTDELLVIGAHYDKVSAGCGAVDNWTGIVLLAQLYRTLRAVKTKKTILFIAFGQEEKGLVGSRAMTDSIKKDQAPQYCAMVNFDSFGLAAPQAADNMSTWKLEKMVIDTAKELKISFQHANIPGADADSTPFVRRGIPAVTIHGLSNDWPRILHSDSDQVSKINPFSLYLAYRLGLAVILKLDSLPCDAFR
jgi:Zn-dependent M28 family amino/carboxypeptidase